MNNHDISWNVFDVTDPFSYPSHKSLCLVVGSKGGLSIHTFFDGRYNDCGEFDPDNRVYYDTGFGTSDGYDIRSTYKYYAVIKEENDEDWIGNY